MYMYMYICVYVYTCIYIYIYISIHTYIHTCIHTYIHTYLHTHTSIYCTRTYWAIVAVQSIVVKPKHIHGKHVGKRRQLSLYPAGCS